MSKLTKALTAAAGNAGESLYVEDVFSTYLYEGTSAAGNVVTNGVDLAGEGGLVWLKSRGDAQPHGLFDTERGVGKLLQSNATAAELPYTDVSSFNSNGFTAGFYSGWFNSSNYDQCSWTFRKAEKFFDVVTYTGNGTSNRQISHNLGSTPGFILIKRTDSTGNWLAWHKEVNPGYGILDLNLAFTAGANGFVDAVADTYFETSWLNTNGATFVAYLFASDAGGFGDDGDENIIKCGSFTTDGSSDAPLQNIGFEPQWIMTKSATGTADWYITDSMRTMSVSSSRYLIPNNSSAETHNAPFAVWVPHAQGFSIDGLGTAGETHIYIAIRRPMKTPESGTEVFSPVAYSGNSTAGRSITSGFPLDWVVTKGRNAGIEPISYTRLQGSGRKLLTYSSAAEANSSTNVITSFDQDGMTVGTDTDINNSSYTYIDYFFKRATGFMDVVAYTGNGGTSTQAHNLGVVPELMIFKRRSSNGAWNTYVASSVLASAGPTKFLELSDTASIATDLNFINGAPTSSLINTGSNTNQNGNTYIAYLFATLAGVSKVGSYTGTGSDLNVDCGFGAGARFILIKRTDSTGGWYYWDSARGITAGNDPYMLWNSTVAEVTNTDYVDPLSNGFTVTSSAPAALNASGGSYIFLAIA